jgi:tetratricopeptide (TPR) repeat protein
MDAEHRHELKSNELVEFFVQLPDFVRKYSNQIIGVCLILIALVVIPLWKNWRQESRRAQQAAMVSRIQTAREAIGKAVQQTEGIQPGSLLDSAAEELKSAAETASEKDLAALARIEEAKLLRSALHLQADVSVEESSSRLSRAQAACQEALNLAQSPTIKGMAELQLGLCAEESGQYEQARDVYTRILQNTAYQGTSILEQARLRLEQLEDNSVKVVFAPAPAENPEPAADSSAQPQSAPVPAGEPAPSSESASQ